MSERIWTSFHGGHSALVDGQGTVAQIAEAAARRSFRAYGFSEHFVKPQHNEFSPDGFKQSSATFAPQTVTTLSSGHAPNPSSAGSNPVQIGRGVKLAAIAVDSSQGSIVPNNPNGLVRRGHNRFGAGPNSGLPIEANPGDGGVAHVIAGATELSNTDVGQNLIDLTLASFQFRASRLVMDTSDQLLLELTSLRRS